MLQGTLEEARAAARYRNVEVRLAGGVPVPPPHDAELVDAHNGIVRLRVSVATDARAFVAGLPDAAAIEHLAFTAPRLTEVFRDVVGASIDDLDDRGAADDGGPRPSTEVHA